MVPWPTEIDAFGRRAILLLVLTFAGGCFCGYVAGASTSTAAAEVSP